MRPYQALRFGLLRGAFGPDVAANWLRRDEHGGDLSRHPSPHTTPKPAPTPLSKQGADWTT